MNKERQRKKSKPGRTLLVFNSEKLRKEFFDGETKRTKIKNNTFLEFESPDKCEKVYEQLEKKYNVKYIQYRAFISFNGLDFEKLGYQDVLDLMSENLKKQVKNIEIVYFNLYKKQGKCIDCGDIFVDLKDHLDLLISKGTIYLDDKKESSARFSKFIVRRRQQNQEPRQNQDLQQ